MTENTINDKHFTAETVAKYDTPVTFRQGREVVLNILRYKNDRLAPSTTKGNADGVNAFWAGKRVLDFACGTGITSLNLAPHVGKVVGIDISDEMLGVFKQKLKSNENHNVSAHLINQLEEDDETMKAKAGPGELFNFDAVVSSLAYHHIDDIDAASRAISDFAGGTRMGESLAALRQHHARRLVGRRTLVLLISDGLDTGAPEVLERELGWLRRHSGRLLWLNPLLRFDGYAPTARGAAVLHRQAHGMLAVHNLARLQDLAGSLAALLRQ